MIVHWSLSEAARDSKGKTPRLATVGFFDGLHRGHQKLLGDLRQWAAELGGEPWVVTFERHPQAVITGKAPPAILSFEHRLLNLAREGVAGALVLPFDQELSRWPAEGFIQRVLKECLQSRHLLLGFDSAIGHRRQGTFAYLAARQGELGIAIRRSEPLLLGGQRISSTSLRDAIREGRLDRLRELTGRAYAVLGRVVRGARRGKALGFPTANLHLEVEAVLPGGVYLVDAAVIDLPEKARAFPGSKVDRWLPGIANFGTRPTFAEAPGSPAGARNQLEVHLLDFDGDLYGKRLEVRFHRFQRAEMKFSGSELLRAQIERDIEALRKWLEAERERRS
ncbi:MAG: riboflavin biosynthesis protein RibF [Planctomycetes bacterium]|nr:riboflavin biosynthesis protein RibF [Planctomycetota bacterium]